VEVTSGENGHGARFCVTFVTASLAA